MESKTLSEFITKNYHINAELKERDPDEWNRQVFKIHVAVEVAQEILRVAQEAISDVAIEMYCDENRSLSDELERNEHEIREAEEIMRRFVMKIKNYVNSKKEG